MSPATATLVIPANSRSVSRNFTVTPYNNNDVDNGDYVRVIYGTPYNEGVTFSSLFPSLATKHTSRIRGLDFL